MKTATAKPKVGGIMQNIDLGYACFQEKYYRVCIARAAANEGRCVWFKKGAKLKWYEKQILLCDALPF